MTDDTEIREREDAADAAAPDASGDGGGREDPERGDGAAEGAESVSAEVDELRDELASLNDKHLRLAAEFDNYRKRNQREREALAARLQADIVSSLLEVLDDLQRVVETGPGSDAEAVLEGVRLVEKKFVSVLETAGLEPLEAEGERFDPETMEALMTVPTGDPERDERVADVFQRGYRFRDTLVRPARVRVWQYDESEAGD